VVYAAGVALWHGYYVRTLGVIALVLFAVVAYKTPRVPASVVYKGRIVLVLAVLLGLTAGYLYRARLIHTYYFMDFWPALSIVGGILYVHVVEHAGRVLRVVLAVAVVLSVVSSAGAAYPITNVVVDDNSGGWFTVDSLTEYADDIDNRTEPGDTVFAANPSYVALSDAKMPADDSRLYYTLKSYKTKGPALDRYRFDWWDAGWVD